MKESIAALLLFVFLGHAPAWSQSAVDIINRVDNNRISRTQKYHVRMIITKGSRKIYKLFTGYGLNNGEQFFITFTNPEDRGVKYLKIDRELWIYFPDADDTMKISGHMLRQGLMGSDISYDDMMETERMSKLYEAEKLDDTVIGGRGCFVVELQAREPSAHYEKQVLYVDRETYVPLKINMYARGGRLLKEMTQHDIKKIGSRYVAHKIIITDRRKENSSTIVELSDIQFDITLPANTFSKQRLRR